MMLSTDIKTMVCGYGSKILDIINCRSQKIVPLHYHAIMNRGLYARMVQWSLNVWSVKLFSEIVCHERYVVRIISVASNVTRGMKMQISRKTAENTLMAHTVDRVGIDEFLSKVFEENEFISAQALLIACWDLFTDPVGAKNPDPMDLGYVNDDSSYQAE